MTTAAVAISDTRGISDRRTRNAPSAFSTSSDYRPQP
jgi:hypothetical protein